MLPAIDKLLVIDKKDFKNLFVVKEVQTAQLHFYLVDWNATSYTAKLSQILIVRVHTR